MEIKFGLERAISEQRVNPYAEADVHLSVRRLGSAPVCLSVDSKSAYGVDEGCVLRETERHSCDRTKEESEPPLSLVRPSDWSAE